MRRTTRLITGIAAAGVATSFLIRSIEPSLTHEQLTAVFVLSLLALVGELLVFLLPRGAHGSVSFIPALAAVLIAPSWHTVAAVAAVKAISEFARRAEIEKAVFNTSQYALTIGLAVLVFLSRNGQSMLGLETQTIGQITRVDGVPAFAAFAVAFAVNTLLVTAVIAVSTNARFVSVWRANNLATIGIDILSSPLIFLFAWMYVRFGPIVAVCAWIPILGLRQFHKTNLELEQTNEELLELMVKSIEARDPYTSGHSRRVQHYSAIIARALGLPEREIESIGRAALLHDVGKIHEKYGPILRKADKLTLSEWNTMREHPVDGANLIATMTKLRELVGPVRHHHENWDGTGYPDGMTGELIPLAARIIRFADTIDAMTTERPYRRSLTSDEVREEIVRCRATQFDPQIVDRLLSSPLWKTMFAPVSRNAGRFGPLAVLPGSEQRQERPRQARG